MVGYLLGMEKEGVRFPLQAPVSVAEWLRSGLQSRIRGFDSRPILHPMRKHQF